MLVSLIIVFREAMEAGLIVGIVLAATQGVAQRGRWISAGIAAGVTGASLVAMSAAALSDALNGVGQEVFTAAILLFAVGMLTWHITWMSAHAREMAQQMRSIGHAVSLGQRSLLALAVVVAVAVLREGAEIVLFMFGIMAESGASGAAMALGGILGLGLAALLSWLLYRGLVAIPVRHLFAVTNGLIALLAAGMAGQAAAILHAADVLPSWGEVVWNSSGVIEDTSFTGKTLHALIGYSARPCGVQVCAWIGTMILLVLMNRLASRPKAAAIAAVSAVLVFVVATPAAQAEDSPTVTFRDHRMQPARVEVPAHTKFKLLVTNADPTAEEFESAQLNREKLVAPGQTITVFLGPLEPGEYKVFGDFHQDTAQGVLVAK